MYAMAWPLVMRQMSIGGFASVFMCGTAIARLSRCNSVRLSVCLSVHLSHGWISQKWCKLG